MTDGQVLYAVLFLLYLADCVLWVDRRSVALVSPWLAGWHPTFGTPPLGNDRGSLLVLNPLLPLGRAVRCHLLPIAISPEGLCATNPQTLPGARRLVRSPDAVSLDAIGEVRADGGFLVIDGERFARCAGERQAAELVDLVRRMKDASAKKRASIVRTHIAARYAPYKAKKRLDRAVSKSSILLATCNVFFLVLFAVIPAYAIRFGFVPAVVPAVAVLYAFAVLIAVLFFFSHRALYPLGRYERAMAVVKMILCPPFAVRAVDLLTVDAATSFSPLAAATALSGQDAEPFALHYLRDLAHPLADGLTDPLARSIVDWHVAEHKARALAHLRKAAPEIAEAFDSPPAPDGPGTHYCPRCRAQFATDHGDCPDCEGVGLVAHPRAAAAATRSDK